MNFIDLVGYLAGTLISISLIPQIVKSWKTKSTGDISLRWMLIYTAGLVLYNFYVFAIWSIPLLLMGLVETALALILIYLKLRYK